MSSLSEIPEDIIVNIAINCTAEEVGVLSRANKSISLCLRRHYNPIFKKWIERYDTVYRH